MTPLTNKLIIPLLITMIFSIPPGFAADPANNGTLTFIYDLNEGQCTIPVNDKRQLEIHHGDKPTSAQPCKGHSIRYIKFNNVRSAVTVSLGSTLDKWDHAVGCPDNPNLPPDNFLFELRTIKNMPSSEPIALDGITNNHVGRPIIPGVLVKYRQVSDTDEVNRQLSCIRINFD